MITFRKAQIEDVPILQDLNNELFIDNSQYDDDLILDWATSEKGQKYFTDLITNPTSFILIASDEKRDVGYIATKQKVMDYRKSKYLEIENTGVIPDYRSKGIGTMLIQKCLEWAKENGFQKMYVNAYFHNLRAISFYKKSGFGETDLGLNRNI